MKFVDLFAGMGGFHRALANLGHECVFASEIDEELRQLYERNFPDSRGRIHGDIRESKNRIPKHDILCAGFPCQPFSKSGFQNGRRDRTRGTLFHEIIEVIKKHHPPYVILENVGNFERHNNGRTWEVVHESLLDEGYDVRGTTHVTSGGHGLISPHHFGFPHTRERFYILATLGKLPKDPFPKKENLPTSLRSIEDLNSALTAEDRSETRLTDQQVRCIQHWNRLLERLPSEIEPPSFPIWGDEIAARYPFDQRAPFATPPAELRRLLGLNGHAKGLNRAELLQLLPSYAREERDRFPSWKVAFIKQNRDWFNTIRDYFPKGWVSELRNFPACLRKLEWNCKGEERNLWRHVLQFRPSGLRSKRYTSSPALVAMTTTQIPILGPKRRFLTRREGLRLQRFSVSHRLPKSRSDAFAALGNAVHVGLVEKIARLFVGEA